MTDAHTRNLVLSVAAKPTIEGGGILVNRTFPIPGAEWFDPFLLLDEMAPTNHAPGKAGGVPPHPHRGFETVTYMLQGELEHKDSAGNVGVIGPGDVQWMTAGDGIVHSEMTSTKIQTEGGTTQGLQLWVNLPAERRRTTPRYQGLTASDIPTVEGQGWKANVVAGTILGETGPAETHTPITHAMMSVESGAEVRIPLPEGYTTLLYVIEGSINVASETVTAQHLAVFDTSGDLSFSTENPTTCLLLAGEPINEPMERYGPFVMNTKAELQTAIEDFNAGRMGEIPAAGGTKTIHQPMGDQD